MWTPQLAPTVFPWAEIQAQYPAAYAALFTLSPATLHLHPTGAAPHQFEQRAVVPQGETEEFAQLAHPADMVLFAREFQLRDLYEFFDGHGLHIIIQPSVVRSVEWTHSPLPVTISGPPRAGGWDFSIATGGGMGPMSSRHEAETTAFLLAFAALDVKLRSHVEGSSSGPAV